MYIKTKIYFRVEKEDEMSCLIDGCNFLLKNIPDEAFLYQRHAEPTYKFQGVSRDIFPYLLVNIGSGVSLIKVHCIHDVNFLDIMSERRYRANKEELTLCQEMI